LAGFNTIYYDSLIGSGFLLGAILYAYANYSIPTLVMLYCRCILYYYYPLLLLLYCAPCGEYRFAFLNSSMNTTMLHNMMSYSCLVWHECRIVSPILSRNP